jgi:hypothetical protein
MQAGLRLATALAFKAAILASSGCGKAATSANEPTTSHGDLPSYRKAVGGLGAGYLFQTHMAIGATADLLGHGAVTPADVTALMETTLGTGANVDEILNEVANTEVGPGDGKTLALMREVNRLLGEQARALHEFATEQSERRARRFDALRAKTWDRLEHLLGLQTPPRGASPGRS